MPDNKQFPNLTRRGFLKASTATVAGALSPSFFIRDANAFVNDPSKKREVTLGFNVPQTGAYADEGADELRGFKLAVKHLNGEGRDDGMLSTMTNKVLKGNGVLGKKVGFTTGDTQTKSDAARASAKRMIEKDGAIMISGGSSSGVAIAVQSLCQEAGVIFMAGITHSNDTTGKDRRRYGFRYFLNTEISGAALAPILEKEFGKDRTAYHLTADYAWGWSQEGSIKKYTEQLGWRTKAAVRTPLGAGDFSQYITPVLNSGADVLVLNHYGKDMVNALTQAVQFGLGDKRVNGKDFQVVVPLYTCLMEQGAGKNIAGIYGTVNWHWTLQDAGSKAFTKSFSAEYGRPPCQAAHTCYVQTLLYANACEMAGTFNPCGVIKALEGFKFNGMGNGPTQYRARDHQAIKDIYIVRGKEKPASQFDLFEIVDVVSAAKTEYPADMKGYEGNLGECKA